MVYSWPTCRRSEGVWALLVKALLGTPRARLGRAAHRPGFRHPRQCVSWLQPPCTFCSVLWALLTRGLVLPSAASLRPPPNLTWGSSPRLPVPPAAVLCCLPSTPPGPRNWNSAGWCSLHLSAPRNPHNPLAQGKVSGEAPLAHWTLSPLHPTHPMVSTKASPRLSRSSSHWLIWGNCSICRHFLLLPLRFPPPPVEANRRYFLIPAIAGLPATLSVVQRPSGSSLGPVHSERPLGPSFCMQHTLAGFQDTHGPQAILLGAPRLEEPRRDGRTKKGMRPGHGWVGVGGGVSS